MPSSTVGWNLSPPLYGPRALLIVQRHCVRTGRIFVRGPLSKTSHK